MAAHGAAPDGQSGRGGDIDGGAESVPDRPPAVTLLDRVEGVRQTGPGRWIARCPAHQDRSPSLSVRELDDGTTLIHCFAGCSAADVVTAVGLEFRDLFPARPGHQRAPIRSRVPAADRLALIDHEALVVALIAAYMRCDRNISDEHLARLDLAVQRIGAARDG
jgi:hypothetical protein